MSHRYRSGAALAPLLVLALVVQIEAGALAERSTSGTSRVSFSDSDATEPEHSIVLITADDLSAWADQETDPATKLERWFLNGTSTSDPLTPWLGCPMVAGSSDPARTLLGFLSGVPPALFGEMSVRGAARELVTIPAQYDQRGGSTGGRVERLSEALLELGRGGVPGVNAMLRLRPVLREMEELEGPFFYWAGLGAATPATKESAEETAALGRVLAEAGGRRDSASMTVVVTSLAADASGTVPVWIRPSRKSRQATGLSLNLAAACSRGSVPLEALTGSLREMSSLRSPPAALPALSEGRRSQIVYRDLRGSEGRRGLEVSSYGRVLTVEWKRGHLGACWDLSRRSECTWTRVESESADGFSEPAVGLEAAALRMLERARVWASDGTSTPLSY